MGVMDVDPPAGPASAALRPVPCPWPPPATDRPRGETVVLWWLPGGLLAELPRRGRIDALLRGVLAAHLGRAPTALRFDREAKGRPFLVGEPDIDFNLSDTRGGTLVAVAGRGRIGIDLERSDRVVDAQPLARRWFAADEANALDALDPARRSAAFIALWTAKEASCKSTGTGIYGWLPQWRFALAGETTRLLAAPAAAGPAGRWRHRRITPAPGYTAVLAVDGFDPAIGTQYCVAG
jgi:4'-phosphopantetheinyl transferase